MSLTQNIKSKLAATTLALGLAFGTAAPAIAQDASANENVQQASLRAPNDVITSDEALELSSGKVVLHYGEGYSPTDLRSLERRIEALGIEVDLYAGGIENRVEFYFFQNRIPKIFSFEDSPEIEMLAESYAKQYGLGVFQIAKNDI